MESTSSTSMFICSLYSPFYLLIFPLCSPFISVRCQSIPAFHLVVYPSLCKQNREIEDTFSSEKYLSQPSTFINDCTLSKLYYHLSYNSICSYRCVAVNAQKKKKNAQDTTDRSALLSLWSLSNWNSDLFLLRHTNALIYTR